mmetsp:Transcript_36619/g.82546  ORF Transcript_36619/g.82546 Transcript_36619/m.82546 type:complete len:216 (-) Transcript_36619:180-827(-)
MNTSIQTPKQLQQKVGFVQTPWKANCTIVKRPRRTAPRKRLPKPGSYPDDFSPFRMTCGDGTVIGLSYLEVKRDLQAINEQCREMFQSVYYAEAGCEDMEQSRDKGSRPCVLSRGRLEPLMAPRRRGQSIKQPTSKAEETRMIMAAVRASLQEIRGRQQEDDGGHEERETCIQVKGVQAYVEGVLETHKGIKVREEIMPKQSMTSNLGYSILAHA